jgi:hypothetical protein
MVKVLFLHGVGGGTRGPKVQRLEGMPEVAEVCAPRMAYSDVGFLGLFRLQARQVLAFAQRQADAFRPDIVVGSSMGARVAIHLETDARRVLLAPACSPFPPLALAFVATNLGCSRLAARTPDERSLQRIQPGTIILHCPDDGVIGIDISRALATRPGIELHEIAFDGEPAPRHRANLAHQMNFPAALDELEKAIRRIAFAYRSHSG